MSVNDDRKELNPQALALVQCEGEIRATIKKDYLRGVPRQQMVDHLRVLIEKRLREVKIESLKRGARRSLWDFAYRQLAMWNRLQGRDLMVLYALMRMQDRQRKDIPLKVTTTKAKEILTETAEAEGFDNFQLYGEPLQRFHQEYIKQHVQPVFKRLQDQYPLDPDQLDGDFGERVKAVNKHNNSLRLKAELEVRYEHNQQMVADLRADGTRLVICSTHADCSQRCRPWQGRVYSLDGTSGTTSDGRKFVPLEVATQIKTENGRWYNGLLGFNCRHKLIPYQKGEWFPTPTPAEEKRQYAITQRQRAMERTVRRLRLEAQMLEGVGTKRQVATAKARAKAAYDKYKQFSQDNGRAFYPSRVQIL